MKFPYFFLLAISASLATAEEEPFERAPISYSSATPQDAVTALRARLASGEVHLAGDEKQVVRGLLAALNVPEASQLLVFSKTSFQKDRIDPAHPRAIYFSDEVYIGWCPGGLVELAALDPVLGPVFYSFDPRAAGDAKRFTRDPDCLRCHGGTFVADIPGLLARSVFTDTAGQPFTSLGSALVDASTPIEQRWGGWYVTALNAGPRHRGNLVLSTEHEPSAEELTAGAKVHTLEKLLDTRPYLVSSSDITALLVFEHQLSVQNVLTKANQDCLRSLAYQKTLQQALHEPVTDEPDSGSVQRVFAEASQKVLDALLCKDEATLPEGGIQGGGAFVQAFTPKADAPSLKQLDLQHHLLKYRCSYLIQSSAFDRLQPALRRRVLQHLWHVLTDPSADPRYDYLGAAERQSIRGIVAAKVRHLPAAWRAGH